MLRSVACGLQTALAAVAAALLFAANAGYLPRKRRSV